MHTCRFRPLSLLRLTFVAVLKFLRFLVPGQSVRHCVSIPNSFISYVRGRN